MPAALTCGQRKAAASQRMFAPPAQAVGCARARTALLARVLAAILPSAPKGLPEKPYQFAGL